MQDQDYRWYKDNLQSLFEQYGNSVLAIKNRTVLGVYHTIPEAVDETAKTEQLGTFIVQQCGPDKSAYTAYIASPAVS